jgi:4-hydroxysphinganine ceramide fatty acyl 2-hydroxylase
VKWWVYYADIILAPAAAMALAYLSGATFFFPLQFVAGWLFWTFLEVFIHRTSHWLPFLKSDHMMHHRDAISYSGPPFWITAIVYLAFFGVLAFVFGKHTAAGIESGILAGYSYYFYVHNLIHRGAILPGSFLYKMKVYHEEHHRNPRKQFGVTTKFWDKFF